MSDPQSRREEFERRFEAELRAFWRMQIALFVLCGFVALLVAGTFVVSGRIGFFLLALGGPILQWQAFLRDETRFWRRWVRE